jgi:cation transport ATPase
MEEQVSETGQELPPWAERMKKGAPQEFEAEGEEEGKAGHLEIGEDFQEEEKEEEEKQGKEAEEEVEELEEAEEEEKREELEKEAEEMEEEKEEAEEETLEEEFPIPAKEVELDEREAQVRIPFQERIEEEAEEAAEERVQLPSRLSIWLKSRAFDFLSIALLWVISLWLASRLVQVSLFKLIFNSTLQVLGFYLVLLVLYFSFFIILLGETLGDLIFSKEG